MINAVSSTKLLNILLPHSNKALGEVLKELPPEEIEKFSAGKDLKTILDTLLKEGATKSRSNMLLLELLQKNPTLRKLGSFANGVEKLLVELKDIKELPKSLKDFQKFLTQVKDLDQKSLQNSIKNSGIFLESKLKSVKEPKEELQKSLNELQNIAKKSSNEKMKNSIKDILSNLKDSPKEITQTQRETVAKKIETLLKELSTKGSGDLPKTQLHTLTSTLERRLNDLQKLFNEPNISLKESSVQRVLNMLQSNIKSILAHKELPKDLSLVLKDISTLIDTSKRTDTVTSDLKSNLTKAISELDLVLKRVDDSRADKMQHIVKELSRFTNPKNLSKELLIKDIIEGDLKATLQKASSEIAKLDIPNREAINSHIDKLLLQIDYNQLVSSLTNSATLFVPFYWDALEEGSIKIAKGDEDISYCDIYLNLKKQGEVRVRLALFDENQLNIYLYSQDDAFRVDLKQNKRELMSALNDLGLNVRDFRVFDFEGDKTALSYGDSVSEEINMGFNIEI